MARIPLPERGQPLDVTYMYQLVEAVNDLATQVSSATYNTTSIDTPSGVTQVVKTADARVVGALQKVVTNSNVNAGTEKAFSVTFSDFKYAPIVTATPVNIGNTAAGRNVSIVITSVTTGRVDGFVRFNSAGNVTLNVNLIIVGIPN